MWGPDSLAAADCKPEKHKLQPLGALHVFPVLSLHAAWQIKGTSKEWSHFCKILILHSKLKVTLHIV